MILFNYIITIDIQIQFAQQREALVLNSKLCGNS
jgi:hypothetical protein